MFPGEQVNVDSASVKAQMIDSLNPMKLSPIELLKSGKRVGATFFTNEAFLAGERFLLFGTQLSRFTHNQVYRVGRNELIRFLAIHINPDRMEGIDLVVANDRWTQFLVCNHDGDAFVVDHERSVGDNVSDTTSAEKLP